MSAEQHPTRKPQRSRYRWRSCEALWGCCCALRRLRLLLCCVLLRCHRGGSRSGLGSICPHRRRLGNQRDLLPEDC